MRRPDPPEARRGADERAELARHIDELMAQPPVGRPAVTVVGDDAVFAIWPSPARSPGGSVGPSRTRDSD